MSIDINDPKWVGYIEAANRETTPVVSLATYLSEESGRLGHDFEMALATMEARQ